MPNDKIAPRIDGTKQEKTGHRPTEYSEWHRTLGNEFLSMDVDFVEYRVGRGIVALFEVTANMENEGHMIRSKPYIWDRTEVQRDVLTTMSEALGVPAYFTLHTKDLSLFHVYDLSGNQENLRKMTQEEYAEFIRSL